MLTGKSKLASRLLANTQDKHKITGQKIAENVIDDLMEIIRDELIRGNNVRLPGVGIIRVSTHKGRKARNISTGSIMNIPPRQNLRLDTSKSFKEELNS